MSLFEIWMYCMQMLHTSPNEEAEASKRLDYIFKTYSIEALKINLIQLDRMRVFIDG